MFLFEIFIFSFYQNLNTYFVFPVFSGSAIVGAPTGGITYFSHTVS
jgi:hypothetical protein